MMNPIQRCKKVTGMRNPLNECVNPRRLAMYILLGLLAAASSPRTALVRGYLPYIAMNHMGQAQQSLEDYTYSTYFGGSNAERIVDLAIDSEGNVVVFGGTYSKDIPTLNAFQDEYGGGTMTEPLHLMGDCFVAKFSDGGELLWSSYLGGSELDDPVRILIGNDDELVLIGVTQSEDFPVTDDALQSSYGGGESDCFLSVLSSDGVLVYATYLGGSGSDESGDFTMDTMGNMVIAGITDSIDFPVSSDAYQPDLGGSLDGFITEIEADRAAIGYSSFFGGDDVDLAIELELDSEGCLIVTGTTESDDFPITDDAFQSNIVGEERDCYIAKFQGYSDLLFSTLLGGDDKDGCFGLGVDSSDLIHIVGRTWSGDFPVTSDAIQAVYGGDVAEGSNPDRGVDGFYAKLSPEGDLLYSTFYGREVWDTLFQVGFHGEDTVVMGMVRSGGFQVVNAFQGDFMGAIDIVLLVLDGEGQLKLSSYLGGAGVDQPWGLVVDDGKLYLVGESSSTDFYTTGDAFQGANRGGGDGIIFTLELGSYLQNVDDIRVPTSAEGEDDEPSQTGIPGFPLESIIISLIVVIIILWRARNL
jgi:hypothetical protein